MVLYFSPKQSLKLAKCASSFQWKIRFKRTISEQNLSSNQLPLEKYGTDLVILSLFVLSFCDLSQTFPLKYMCNGFYAGNLASSIPHIFVENAF